MTSRIAQIVIMRCGACGLEIRLRQRAFVRVLFAERIRVPVELAACRTCEAVVECESIAESEEALYALKRSILEEGRALGYDGWPDDQGFPHEREIDEQLRFLPHRLGPPRCLSCEGTALVHAQPGRDGNPAVPHLGCGGLYELVGLDFEDDDAAPIAIDIEGMRLGSKR